MEESLQNIGALSFDPFQEIAIILEHRFENLLVRLHREERGDHRFIAISKTLATHRKPGQTWIEIPQPDQPLTWLDNRKKPLVPCGAVCSTAKEMIFFTICLHVKDAGSFVNLLVPAHYLDEPKMISALYEFALLTFKPDENPKAFLHAWMNEKIAKYFPINWGIGR